MSVLLVLTNLPDRAAAERLGSMLVEKQLAACVNILAPCRSVYRWKGAIQHDEEHPIIRTNFRRSSRSQWSTACRSTCNG